MRVNFDYLRDRLKVHSQSSELALRQNHPMADSFFQKYGLRPGKIREHAVKLLSSGLLAGSLLLPPAVSLPPITQTSKKTENISVDSAPFLQLDVSQKIKAILPPTGQWELSGSQEDQISNLLRDDLGIKTTAKLDGNRLPKSYGRMGAEQLLPRYPGDSAEQHDGYWDKGQTPGLGGWGYFAYSKDKMTDELYAAEKYYVAVPIIYLPDWQNRVQYYVDWYKYRRMVAVNPANGKVIITAVADAGPANWTGKHFGGSPAVMDYLGINYGMQNHPVVMFFLDDPNHEVPLGPLEYNVEKNKKALINQA